MFDEKMLTGETTTGAALTAATERKREARTAVKRMALLIVGRGGEEVCFTVAAVLALYTRGTAIESHRYLILLSPFRLPSAKPCHVRPLRDIQ